MDQKPMRYHHCGIIRKHNLFTFENFVSFCTTKLVFKCLHNHVSPLFSGLIERRTSSGRATRAVTNGDCTVPTCSNAFGKSAFSVKGVDLWNSLPTVLKLETDANVFYRGLKLWMKSNQLCSHE